MREFLIPAEAWQKFAAANSCSLAAEAGKGKVIAVRTAEHEGSVYTAFGTVYGSYGKQVKSYVSAYRLLLPGYFGAETTPVYHDEAAIAAGRRLRGDHVGLIVSVNGRQMVCAEAVKVVRGLPTVRPVSRHQAESYNAAQVDGWRALWHRDSTAEWFSLQGHPVVRYRKAGNSETTAVLFWRNGKVIEEMTIADDVALDPPDLGDGVRQCLPNAEMVPQLALF